MTTRNRTGYPVIDEILESIAPSDPEQLHCLDCNRLANTECVEQGHGTSATESAKCSHSDKQWRLSENNPADVMCGYDYIATGTTRKHATQIFTEHNQYPTLVEQRDTARGLVTRLTTEKQRVEQDRSQALEALKSVAIMLNTELEKYDDEPWAQRVRAAITTIEQSVKNAGEEGQR